MEAVFLSKFYNHHQMPLSRSFYQMLGDHYLFVETTPMDAERRQMGYQEFEEPFVCQFGDCPKACMDRISQADVVIFGSAPEKLIRERLKKGKLVFQYSERIYKIPPKWYEMPARAAKYYLNRGRFQNCYLLCASAFVSQDYNRTKTYPNRMYRWGYFPETKHYRLEELAGRCRYF